MILLLGAALRDNIVAFNDKGIVMGLGGYRFRGASDPCLRKPSAQVDNNLLFKNGQIQYGFLCAGTMAFTLEERSADEDVRRRKNDVVDPGFEAPENGDFRLRFDSSAARMASTGGPVGAPAEVAAGEKVLSTARAQ